ncbi:MAG: DUF4345 domain-containing protein [Bacteroidales bacterium]
MKISKIILFAGALIYFAFGFLFFLNPDIITTMDGIILPTRSSANHIRAPLGGMEIGLGFVLVFFALRKETVIYGLIVLSGSIGFTSLARLYGILFDGAGDMSNWLSFGAEFAFGLAALVCYGLERKKQGKSSDPMTNITPQS